MILMVSGGWSDEDVSTSEEVAVVLTRADALPSEVQTATDPYFEGYIQALVDMHYAEYQVTVIVKDKDVWLANLPNNKLYANSIISFVKDVPGVKEVHVLMGFLLKRWSCRRNMWRGLR